MTPPWMIPCSRCNLLRGYCFVPQRYRQKRDFLLCVVSAVGEDRFVASDLVKKKNARRPPPSVFYGEELVPNVDEKPP